MKQETLQQQALQLIFDSLNAENFLIDTSVFIHVKCVWSQALTLPVMKECESAESTPTRAPAFPGHSCIPYTIRF